MDKNCNLKIDPPSADEEYAENRRQRLKNHENGNSTKMYSTIRFSKELEVFTKQSFNHCSTTPTKSILRTKSKGNHVSTRNQSLRRKDALLDKVKRTPQDLNDTGPSRKLEPPDPVRPRRDWNIESLFASSNEKKRESRQSAMRSQRVDPKEIPARVSKYEQIYSSEYLLTKYAANSAGFPLSNTDQFVRKLNVKIFPKPSSDCASISVSGTPKGSINLRRMPFSDSKLNEKSTTKRRLITKKGRNKKLSYLQLEDSNPNEENIAPNDLEFNIEGGCDLGSLIQRYPMNSPKSSIASYGDFLIQKNTSDTDNSDVELNSGHKRFDWDGLYEDAPYHFNNEDFHSSDSKRPKTAYKAWSVWVLVGTVCACLASTLIVFLTIMAKRGEPSISIDKFAMVECNNHENANGKFVSDRYETIRLYLLFQSAGNLSMMDQPGSPQREALCWISEFDGYNIDTTSGNEEAIIQRYSLVVLHFSTINNRNHSNDNSGSTRNTYFPSAQHECGWDSIICNNSRDVMILRLSNKSLSGNLPPEIGNLTTLNFIDLSLNQLTGTIPTSIAQLTSLEYLSLAFNEFKTTIPTVLGRMTSLTALNLRSSEFLQQIPTDIGYLSNLELLLLDGNSLSGTIPRELGNLSHAEQINFRGNDLLGTVPKELCELRSSKSLKELAVEERVYCDCCT